MARSPVPVRFALFVAALACAPRVEPESPPLPAVDASEETCPPISLDEAAKITVKAMRRRGWRFESDVRRIDSSRIQLQFENLPLAAFVHFGVGPSNEELDQALTPLWGYGSSDLEPLGELLAAIGDRAMGFTLTRVIHEEHPRGTRQREWKYSQINFVHCDVLVKIGVELGADHVVSIARELDEWVAEQACC